ADLVGEAVVPVAEGGLDAALARPAPLVGPSEAKEALPEIAVTVPLVRRPEVEVHGVLPRRAVPVLRLVQLGGEEVPRPCVLREALHELPQHPETVRRHPFI